MSTSFGCSLTIQLIASTGNFIIFCTRDQVEKYTVEFKKMSSSIEMELSLIFNNRNMFTQAQQSKRVRDHCFFGVRGFKKAPTTRLEYKRFQNFPPIGGSRQRFNIRNEEFSNSNVVLYFKPPNEEYVKDSEGKNLRVEQKPLDLLKELIVMYVFVVIIFPNK